MSIKLMINKRNKFFIFFLLFCLASGNSSHGSPHIDSLLTLLKKDKPDTNKVNHLNALANLYISSEPKQALNYAQQALSLAKKINWKKGIANSFHIVGYYYYSQGDYPNTIDYWLKALKTREDLGDKNNISATLGNIGIVYRDQADYSKAIDYSFRALKMKEELGDKKDIANTLSNIGIVYWNQSNYPKALNNYFRALKMAEELGDKKGIAIILGNIGIVYRDQAHYPKALVYYFRALKIAEEHGYKQLQAITLGNIGLVYNGQNDYPKALDYYFRALKMAEELGNKNNIAVWLGNIGIVYTDQADYPKALDYYFRALKMKEELGDKNGIAINLGNIGALYTTMGQETTDKGQKKKLFADAEKYLLDALTIDKEIGAQNYERQFEELLSTLYEKSNRPTLALEHFKKARTLKDTIFNEEKSKDIGKLEAKHDYEMTELKRKQQEEENQRQEAVTVGRRNKLQYSGIVIGLMFLFISIFLISKKFKKTASIFETDTIHRNEKNYRRNVKIIEITLFISFLIFFEFISVLLDPFKEQLTGGAPLWKLLINAVVAGAIFPIHNLLERKLSPIYTGLRNIEDEREKGGKGERGKGRIGIVFGLAMVLSLNYGFDTKTDSLIILLKKDKPDSNKVRHLNALVYQYISSEPKQALKYAQQALSIAQKLEWKKGIGDSFHSLGYYYYTQGEYTKTLDYWLKVWKTSEELGDKNGIAQHLGNIGSVYMEQADYPKALEYYFRALKKAEELRDKNKIAPVLGNIGIVYKEQADYPKALEYYFRALKMKEEMKNKREIAITLGNIGNVYVEQADYPKALDFYFKALMIAEELRDKNGVARHLGNIGIVYDVLVDFPKALDYYFRALKIEEELGDKRSAAINLSNIGSLYTAMGEDTKGEGQKKKLFATAEKYLLDALNIDKEIGTLDGEIQDEEALTALYEKSNRPVLALEHYKKAMALKDTIFNEEKSKDIGKLEARHEFEMTELKRKQQEMEESRKLVAAVGRRNMLQYSEIVLGLLILFIIILIIAKRFKKITNEKMFLQYQKIMEGTLFVSFLIFFEFILVLMDPYIEQFTGGIPLYKLLINVAVAGIIFPIHQFLEGRVKGGVIVH